MLVISPQAFGVNSIAFGDNSKAYGDNSKGYGDRIIRIKRFNLEREKAYATGTDAIHCCLIPLAGCYFFSVSSSFGLHGSGKIEPVKKSC
ncbi:left-handed beta-roll domain-containing protein [Phocaeicola dorei]|uniref:Trimeric autotransporter adhesin YadA-like head domain-containing protein n=1 Tax=Phocaeicola dorei TaxID=357276 RepID=A0A5M5ZY66_9BACT|nr:left-handed beta-roll domain-containing protein [Phocaeicola dorei]KAA5385536.1 hypothetical protein F2Y61_05130 [Phocaeicola dorei]MBT1307473.1 left-handed beta-roll domain-containing protein [Phocaeicola dorei]MBT1312210.1 left-handed beta-roll domain-containing protein [Phocaeicola dorei]MCE9216885.1 left-handed beta-roll domain-containing protein [Phocaeicola dorei]